MLICWNTVKSGLMLNTHNSLSTIVALLQYKAIAPCPDHCHDIALVAAAAHSILKPI